MKDYIPEIEYDPNSAPKQRFATYRPSRRSGPWKTHTSIGNARNAARQGGPAIIYEFVNGRWDEFHKAVRNVACTICGQDYRKNGPNFIPEDKTRTYGTGQFQRTSQYKSTDIIVDADTQNEVHYFGQVPMNHRGLHKSCREKHQNMAKPIKSRLESCVGPDTAVDYEESENSKCIWRGQCVPVTLIVQDELGGKIMRTVVPNDESHYYNVIEDTRLDLTREQYPEYDDSDLYDRSEVRERSTLLAVPDVADRYDTLKSLYDMTKDVEI